MNKLVGTKFFQGKLEGLNTARLAGLALISFVFGIAYDLSYKLFEDVPLSINSVIVLRMSILYFLIILMIFLLLNSYKGADDERRYTRQIFAVSFVCLLILYLFVYIEFFPGVGKVDTLYILQHDVNMAAQHPWFYCVCVRLLRDLVYVLGGDARTVIGISNFFQMLVSIGLSSYIVSYAYRKRVPYIICFFIWLFYYFNITMGIFSITMVKDIPFSQLLVLLSILLYEVLIKETIKINYKTILLLALVCSLIVLIRNNGSYIIGFVFLSVLLFQFKKLKKIYGVFLIALGVVIMSKVVVINMGITPLFKESVGIPLQQIAAVVVHDGEINEEQKTFLNEIMPLEDIKERYNPYSADELKWRNSTLNDRFLSEHKVEFVKLWMGLLPSNFKIYVEAYLKNTYGFWNIKEKKAGISTTLYNERYDQKWMKDNSIEKETEPSKLKKNLEEAGSSFIGEGMCVWLLISILFLAYLKRGKTILVLFSPILGMWITLFISLPIAYQWRYIYATPVILPFFTTVLFEKNEN